MRRLSYLEADRATRAQLAMLPPMVKASRYHVVRALFLGVLLAVVALAGLFVYREVDQQQRATHAAGLVRGLLDAQTTEVPALVAEVEGYRRWTDPLLRQEVESNAGVGERLAEEHRPFCRVGTSE